MTNSRNRQSTRVDSLNLSYIRVEENGELIAEGMGRTLNVSETGILLETPFRTHPDQDVSVTIAVEEDLIDIKGKVVRCQEMDPHTFQTGVLFLEVDETGRQTIQHLIGLFNPPASEDR